MSPSPSNGEGDIIADCDTEGSERSDVDSCFFSHSSCQKIQTSVSIGWFISNLFSVLQESILLSARRAGNKTCSL